MDSKWMIDLAILGFFLAVPLTIWGLEILRRDTKGKAQKQADWSEAVLRLQARRLDSIEERLDMIEGTMYNKPKVAVPYASVYPCRDIEG